MAGRDVRFTLSAEDRTRAAFAQVQKGLASLTGFAVKVSAAFTAIGGATIGSVLASAAANAVRTAGALADLSDRTGISVRNLSELKFAAEQSDSSLESLAKGVGNLSRVLFAAQTGNTKAQALFQSLQIDPAQVRDSKELLLQLADQIADIQDPFERSAVAAQLFGRSVGQEMVTFLAQGREGIQALFDEANKSGLVIDEKFARAVDQANDNLSALGATLTGAVAVGLNESVQRFTDITKAMRDAAREGGDLIDVLRAGASAGFDSPSDPIVKQKERVKELRAEIERLQNIDAQQIKWLPREDVTNRIKSLSFDVAAAEETLGRLQDEANQDRQKQQDADNKAAAEKEKFAERYRRAQQEQAATLQEEKRSLEEANRSIEALAKQREAIGKKFKSLVAEVRSGPSGSAESLLDVSAINIQARRAIDQGDPETAIALAEKAGDALKRLQEDGKEGGLAAAGMATQIQKIAEEAAKLQEQQGLEKIAPKLDIEQTITDVDALRTAIVEKLKGIEVSIKFKADTSSLPAGAQPEAAPEGFAFGGFVRGPGTSTSDSILARLSRGEYVVPAAAVAKYGVAFFERIRNLQVSIPELPRFAAGGLVKGSPAAAGPTMVFRLPGGETVRSSDSPDSIRRIINRAALKVGKRR